MFGNKSVGCGQFLRSPLLFLLPFAASLLSPDVSVANESGVSFWLPGQYGSFAASPAVPGWTWTTFYYHTSVNAGANRTFNLGGRVVAGLDARGDLAAIGPTYVFSEPLLGAQAAVSILALAGRSEASISATLTGPRGNVISGSVTDARWGIGDLYPQATLKWNKGVNNYMTYLTGDIPVGTYNAGRLANIGIGHGAIDGGVGYTYLNEKTGREFSVVTGFTYNFENTHTDYKNGIDWHVDFGAAQFLSKQIYVGPAGYFFQQLTGDSGPGATLGPFKSRIAGLGLQAGYLFPVGKMQGAVSLKGYGEFAAKNRPQGWNLWLAFVLSPPAPK